MIKTLFSLFLILLFSHAFLNAHASSRNSFDRLYSLSKNTDYLGIDKRAHGNEFENYQIQGSSVAENNRFLKIAGNLFPGDNIVNEETDLLLTNTPSYSHFLAKEYLFNIYPSHNFW